MTEQLLSYEVTAEWGVPYRTARLEFLGTNTPVDDDEVQIKQSDWTGGSPITIFNGRVIQRSLSGTAPEKITTTALAVSAGWFLTKQYINFSTMLVIPGISPNPKEYIKEWLGGSSWKKVTGCEPVWLDYVPNWVTSYAHNRLLLSPARTTKWDAIAQICDKYNMVAWTQPAGSQDYDEFRFYTHQRAYDYIFDTKTYLSGKSDIKSFTLTGCLSPESEYNRVRVYSSTSDWDYVWATAEYFMVNWGWRPIEYSYGLPEIQIPNASVVAETLLDRFRDSSPLLHLVCRSKTKRYDGGLLRPGDLINVTNVNEMVNGDWRIYKIVHRVRSGEEAETEIFAARFDDLSHPYVPQENPFRRLVDETQERILKAASLAPDAYFTPERTKTGVGAATGTVACVIESYDPDTGLADVRVLSTGQIIKGVRVI